MNSNQLLTQNNVLMCFRNSELIVMEQNELSTQTCGNMIGQFCKSDCTRGCTSLCGPELLKNMSINESAFHITTMPLNNGILTVGTPASNEFQQAMHTFNEKNLTPREIEVALEIIKAQSNKAIEEKLAMSKATLKTHINNIYKKLGTEKKLLARKKR